MHDNEIPFMTKSNARSIQIRFGVGGEQEAYLHIDKVRLSK